MEKIIIKDNITARIIKKDNESNMVFVEYMENSNGEITLINEWIEIENMGLPY